MDERYARSLVDAAVGHARNLGIAVTVTVVDAGGHVVMKLRMDGASLISVVMSEDKAYSAAALRTPTGDLTPLIQPGAALFGLTSAVGGRILPFGGGYPLYRADVCVGGIGVSGGSVEEDVTVAEAALAGAQQAAAA